MEQNKMSDNQFDALWQRAEAEGYASRLAAEYPAWRARRRRTEGSLLGMALVAAVALPLALREPAMHDFDRVVCNRTGIADAQWAALAADLLKEA